MKLMIEIYSQNIDGAWFSIACAKHQILASSFGANQRATLSEILRNIPLNLSFEVFHEPSIFAKGILTSIKSIYNGEDVKTSFILDLNRLPLYTQKTLKATAKIPLGYVTSYGSIAKAVGGGPRAVGNVMASNPFAPIIPCHRVVKSDFKLGGYGGGLKLKLEILNREKRGFSLPTEVEVNGRLLQVFPVEYSLGNFA